jgi:hypothetical protein
MDHYQSEAHRLSWRYSYDSQRNSPGVGGNTVTFPGFIQEGTYSHHNFLFADSYTFGPSYTNEFPIFPRCTAGYQNPDTGSCVTRSDVHWVEGTGFPNAATVGRNTLRTGGSSNFDLNLTKSIPLGEMRRLELRWEALNAFNHPQFVQVPQMIVNGTPAGRFLNRDFTDGGIRSIWVQVKLVF